MKLLELLHSFHAAARPQRREYRHQFIIGPKRTNPLLRGTARLYYCANCEWSFLVGDDKVLVLDGHGEPIVRDESERRYATFAEGPCPTLVNLAEMELSDGPMACHPHNLADNPAQDRYTDDRYEDRLDSVDNDVAERRPAANVRPRPLYAIRGGA